MNKKHVAILCGSSSYEHEVSIITGLQVAEAIDTSRYIYSFIYFDKINHAWLIKDFKKKSDFKNKKRLPIEFVRHDDSVCLQMPTLFNRLVKIDVCYLAFHGGSGESGPIQGMLELLGVAHTSPPQEGSVIAMNKALTKEVLRAHNLPTLPSLSVFATNYKNDKQIFLKKIAAEFDMPVIIKPVHLGSSIAIKIAHNETELEKYLNIATRLDNEILVEPALSDFTEFNVSLRSNGEEIEVSPIEEPQRAEEFLSFADKYTKGGKKTGNNQAGGMEMLDRTVPAKIDIALADKIIALAKAVYRAIRLKGLVRIDFMYSKDKLYCTEVNPIPGSMSFYLWEAAGEQFQDQITLSLEDAIKRFQDRIEIVPYKTNIVDKFIG